MLGTAHLHSKAQKEQDTSIAAGRREREGGQKKVRLLQEESRTEEGGKESGCPGHGVRSPGILVLSSVM